MAIQAICISFLAQSIIIITILLLSSKNATSIDDNSNNLTIPLRHECQDRTGYTYITGSMFHQNLNHTLFSYLLSNASQLNSSMVTTTGAGINQVFASYYCRGDVDAKACRLCVQDAVHKVVDACKLRKQGIIWYKDCTLRYANYSFLTLEEFEPRYRYYNRTSLVSANYLRPYQHIFMNTMEHLIDEALHNASIKSFARKEVDLSSSSKLGGVAQCNPFIDNTLCKKCLTSALGQMDLWANTLIFLPNCLMGFDLHESTLAVPISNGGFRHSVRTKVLIPVITVVLVILALFTGFCFWKQKRHWCLQGHSVETPMEKSNIAETRLPKLRRLTFSQVEDITGGFNKKLGEGSFGEVFHGRLREDNKEVAVKVLTKKNDTTKQFSNEIEVLGSISHRNLVSLIGYCDEGTHLALIFEFMSGGDLKALLSGERDGLSWKKRLEIAIHTAQGLEYLHHHCNRFIVHRDVKPANILLTQELQAKLADFGFSKIFPEEHVSRLIDTRIIGTPGYLDPTYKDTGELNSKSDVYSYGVVLLELITGKPAVTGNQHVTQWVGTKYDSGDIRSIVDSSLLVTMGGNFNTAKKATKLALECVQREAGSRPTMREVVKILRECLPIEDRNAGNPISVPTSPEVARVFSSTSSIDQERQ